MEKEICQSSKDTPYPTDSSVMTHTCQLIIQFVNLVYVVNLNILKFILIIMRGEKNGGKR